MFMLLCRKATTYKYDKKHVAAACAETERENLVWIIVGSSVMRGEACMSLWYLGFASWYSVLLIFVGFDIYTVYMPLCSEVDLMLCGQ